MIYQSLIRHFFGREKLTVLHGRAVAITPGSGFYFFADTDSLKHGNNAPEIQAPVTGQILKKVK